MNNEARNMLNHDIPSDMDSLYRYTTESYIDSLPKPITLSNEELRIGLMAELDENIRIRNSMYSNRRQSAQSLPIASIADLILAKYQVACISWTGNKDDGRYVGIYQDSGHNKGIYVNSEDDLRNIIQEFKYTITSKEYEEIYDILASKAPARKPCDDADLFALNNGIFNYKSKTLMDFTPDIVFTRKSYVNYVDSPVSPHITMPDGEIWDFDSWLHSLTDDADIENLLLHVIGAVLRPNVRWDKIVCMYSQLGMNGKGTLCALMKQLCGEGSYVSLRFVDFDTDALLAPLIRATAIITDENATNDYAKDVSRLKALATGDSISINRKFKEGITFKYSGLIVQCVNKLPRAADQTDSFYRRFLMIPFDKTFKGIERKYIKDDYLKRPEVLEYVLWKVLSLPDFYKLPEPDACKALLEEYKEFNDPVVEFVEEIFPNFVWNKIPFKFIYDLFKEWFKRTNGSGIAIRKAEFKERLLSYIFVKYSDDWEYIDEPVGIGKSDNLEPELLITDYNLYEWKSSYAGIDPKKICLPNFKKSYRGVLISRKKNVISTNDSEVLS